MKIFVKTETIAHELRVTDELEHNIFNFLVAFAQANHGNSPTITEIGLAIDIMYGKDEGTTSTSVIYHALDNLEDSGLIEMPRNEEGRRYSGRIIIRSSEWRYYGSVTRTDGGEYPTEPEGDLVGSQGDL